MGLIDVYRINPADQFSVFSPSLKKTQEITYYTLLAKIRGDLNITGTSGNVDNWDQAYDQTIMSGVVTGYTTKTITLTRRDGTEISFDFQDLSPASEDTLDMVTTRGNSTVNTINVGGVTSDYLLFDTAATPTLEVGMMAWNAQDGTADIRLMGNNVTLQIGQEQVVRVVNKTGSDLLEANYQAVKITGAQGNRLKIGLARADSDANSADTIGIVTETINDNQEGFVTSSGLVRSIDTTGSLQSETWADGDVLYLSPITFGQLTNIKPLAPQHTVIVGFVVRAHQTQGQIYVKVDNGYEIDELHNVRITSVTNNQILKYNSSLQVWQNVDISTLATTLAFSTIAVAGQSSIVAEAIQDTLNIASGTGISLTTDASTDTLTITNNAPDQIVSLTAGSNVTITGTYPSFTIAATDQYSGTVTSVNLTAGSGMAVAGGPITTSGSITVTNIDKGSDQNIFKNVAVTGQGTIVADSNNDTLTVDPGTGISLTTNATTDTLTITNTAPDQVVSIAAGTGISTSGTYPSFTVTNTAPDQTVVLTGTGTTTITGTYPNFTINSDDQYDGTVTSVNLIASTGISVSGGPITTSGSITVTNTAPDQVVVLNAGTGISTSGTYPNFTVTNTAPDQVVSITAGTGMSVSGTYPSFTVTNTAPDQVVSITGAGTSVVTGTYPNFTITSNDQYVGTVTSVNLTAGTGITVSGGPITSSGSITVNNSDRGSSQNIFKNIAVPGQTTIVASINNDTFTIKPGSGISATTLGNDVTLSNIDPGSSQNIFKNIAVAGQNTIVADSNNDTLSFVAGTGISLTTNDTTDSLTVTNSAPDQVVALSSGTGISVSGTYPNFTITNTSPSSGGTVTGTGTTNYVTKWTTSSNIGDSQIFDNGTNVGIGTTSPGAKLDVNNGANSEMRLTTSASGILQVGQFTNGAYIGTTSSNATAGILRLGTNSSERIRIDVNGNVGIGTTSPTKKLQIAISDSAHADEGILLQSPSGYGEGAIYHDYGQSNGTTAFKIWNTYTGSQIALSQDSYSSTGSPGSIRFYTSAQGTANVPSERLRITSTGNVGIGTTSPGYKLEVNGTGRFNGELTVVPSSTNGVTVSRAGGYASIYGSNDLVFETDGVFYFGVYTPRLFSVNSSFYTTAGGNVGIGTASPAGYAGRILDIGGASTVSLNFHTTTSGSTQNDGATLYYGSDNSLRIVNYESDGIVRIDTQDTERMRITSGGNVGIGTTSPGQKLDVNGNVVATSFGGRVYPYNSILGSGADASTGTVFAGSTNGYVSSIDVAGGGASNPNTIIIKTASTERMRITSAGNVGIGTTSPSSLLEIAGASPVLTINRTSGTSSTINFNSSGSNFASIISNPSNGENRFSIGPAAAWGGFHTFYTDTSERMRITAAGNVGIGTTAPNERLHVAGRIMASGSGYTLNPTAPIFGQYAATRGYVQVPTNGQFEIWNGATAEIATFYENRNSVFYGNVGIGTTSPGGKLEVNHTGAQGATSLILRTSDFSTANGTIRWQNNVGTNQAGIGSNYTTSDTGALEFLNGNTCNLIIRSSGNVGIGTTSPQGPLEIYKSNAGGLGGHIILNNNGSSVGNETAILFNDSGIGSASYVRAAISSTVEGSPYAGDIKFKTGISAYASLSTQMIIKGNGNVGIGTTSPTYKFNVVSNAVAGKQNLAAIDRTAQNFVTFTNPQYSTDASMGLLLRVFPQSDARQGAGIIASGGSNNATTDLDLFVTTSPDGLGGTSYSAVKINGLNGNVGIGTTSPGYKLDVNGSARVNNTLWVNNSNGTAVINAYSGGQIGTYLAKSSSATANFTTTGVSYPRGLGFGAIIGQGNTTDIPVNNASWNGGYGGNIGFWSDVHYGVEGGTNSIGFNAVIKGSGNSNSYGFFSDLSGATDGTRYGIYTKGEQQNYFSGNVGIGTTSPSNKLTVRGSGAIAALQTTAATGQNWLDFQDSAGASKGYVGYGSSGTNDLYLTQLSASSNIAFYNGGSIRLVINSSGNVGIGTTSPSQKLHVVGSRILVQDGSNAGLMINTGGVDRYSVASTSGAFQIYDEVALTNRFYITSTGNVGIGTTSPGSKLTVIGDIATSTRVASDTINGYTGGSTPLTIQTGGAQNLIIGTNNTERIRVTAAGDVGIGTTSPSAPLTIVSQVNNGSAILTIRSSDNFGYSFARSNTTGFLEFDGNQTGNIGYVFKNGNVGIGTTSPASRLHVETSSSNPFRMVRTGGSATNFGYEFGSGAIGLYDYTNSTYRYYITSGGNVGIGTTSPVASLDVRGAGNAVHLQSTSNDVWQTFKPQTGNTWRIQAQTSNNFGIYDENASSFRFLINSSGNVGIGTTSPLFNLQVGANSGTIATTTIRLQNSYLDSNGYYGFNIDAVDNGVNGHDLRFLGRTSPTGAFSEVVRIKNSGNVGIGTTSPGASLHVAGAINSTPTGDGFLAGIQSGYAVIHLNGSAATGSLIDFSVSGTDTKGRILYDNINNYFGFNTNGAERLKITSTGDVGIGTSSPSAKLHVIGNATVSATLSTVNAKITGTLTDYLNQPGTAGQILSSTGTGIEWITGGGGGGGSTIIVKDQGTTIGSSFTTLDFIGDNVNATASGSTAVIEVTGRASSGSIYYEAVTTPFVIPGFGFVNVEIDTQIVQATAPASLTGSNKLIATVTFGVRNVSLFEGFNGFKFRLYNFPQTSAVPNTTHNWTAYMSKDEFCDTTQFTFHIPIDPSVVSAGDDIRVQADALTNYTPEIYYCALTLMEGTA